jgi:CRP-like cAMP-binding protein
MKEYNKENDFVFHKGDIGDVFYIIENGELDCLNVEDGSEIFVRKLIKGNHFGELALIKNEPRSLSIKVTS